MEILDPNKKALSLKHPHILESLAQKNSERCPFKFDDENRLVVKIKKSEHFVYPGELSKDELLKIWAKNLRLKNKGLYVFFGLGDGSHLSSLLARSKDDFKIILFEPDTQWLCRLLGKKDCSEIFLDKRVFIASKLGDVCQSKLDKILAHVDFKEVRSILYTPVYIQSYDHEYKQFFNYFVNEFKNYRSLIKSRQTDNSLWERVTLENMGILQYAPDVRETVGIFKKKWVIMVSAGPSLDKSIEFLKCSRRHAVIVCINSAYSVLRKHGIIADITIAGDPRESTFSGYKGCATEGSILMCPFYVNPEVVKTFKGRIFTWSNSNPLIAHFYEDCKLGSPTPIDEQGTVSASIFSLCKLWGVSDLILVGQDLAVKENGQTHAKDSFYGEVAYPKINYEKCKRLAGNLGGESVFVEETLYIYYRIFEQLIGQYKDIRVINTSVDGVKIEGAKFMGFDEVLKLIQDQNVEAEIQVLKGLPKVRTLNKDCKDFLKNRYNLFSELFKLSLENLLLMNDRTASDGIIPALKDIEDIVHKLKISDEFQESGIESYLWKTSEKCFNCLPLLRTGSENLSCL